ncbi:MAG: DUF2474 domain-containing protein [Woeseia sp.]
MQRRPQSVRQPGPNWWKRLAWLVLIWTISVAGLALVAYLLKLLMHSAGLVS